MKLIFILFLIPSWGLEQEIIDLKEIRSLYQRAPLEKSASREFSSRLGKVDSSALPVLQCYKGASLMIEAKYGINPISKMDKFNGGKNLVQSAVSRDSLNLEMRFIRFSLQSNLPAFLGYHSELAGDRAFLLRHTGECSDTGLKLMITNYLNSLKPVKAD